MELNESTGRLTRLQWAMLAAVLLLGLALRIYGLGDKSLWYDEAWSLAYAENLNGIGNAFDVASSYEPPAFLALVKGYQALLDSTVAPEPYSAQRDAWLRGLPMLFGLVSMVLLFFVARLTLRNNSTAIAATFLYAISPYQIRYAQELRSYSLWTALALIALYSLVRAMRENRLRHWAALAAAETLMLYTHFFSAWLILSINLYILAALAARKNLRDPRIKPWLASQALAALLSIPSLLMLMRVMGLVANIKYHWYALHGPKIALIAFKAFFAGFSPNAAAYWPLFVLTAGLFVIGLYALRRRWETAVLLGALVAVPLAGNVALTYLNQFSLYELRLFIVPGVAACIVVAAGLVALERPWLKAVAATALAALMLITAADYYADRLHPVETHRIGIWEKIDLRAAARYVRQNAREGDVVGHPGHFSRRPFMQYAPDVPQYLLGHSVIDQQVMVDIMGSRAILDTYGVLPEPVQDVADAARRIWFVDPGGLNFNWPPMVKSLREWLDTHAVPVDFQQFDGVTLTCYETLPAPQPVRLRNRLNDAGNGWTVNSAGLLTMQDNGRFTYSVTVSNLTGAPQRLDVAVYETDGAVEPLAWRRTDPMTNPWRPESQYDPETGGLFNRPSMTATLNRETTAAEMQGWTILAPGRYVPFLRVFEEPDGASRASAALSLAPNGPALGTLDGVAVAGQRGWHWRRLGEFVTPGGTTLFTLRAENAHGLETAWFQLERILFMAPGAAGIDGAPVSQQFEINLGPAESKDLKMEGRLAGRDRARIDVEVFDPATRTYGTISFETGKDK